MIEFRLASYSEVKVREIQNLNFLAKPSKIVSLKSIQRCVEAGVDLDVQFTSVFPEQIGDGRISSGQYISIKELSELGVEKILVRWDQDRKVNMLTTTQTLNL